MFGWFKRFDVNLCPDVQGRITLHGEPVPDVRITRSLEFMDDKERVDHTVTDASGAFFLPEKNIRSSKPGSMFGLEFTNQDIVAEYRGEKYIIWSSPQFGIKKIEEYRNKLTSLNCELASNPVQFEFKNKKNPHIDHYATSICRWSTDCKIFEEFKDS
jgi:hypothetical protein